ncbi:hypothetical protein BDR26DRAFT_868887 [Obelidium mucronatum]|nr:hypothetical protein BDR26DRAFT_868887 [Obelidium mucronatum]
MSLFATNAISGSSMSLSEYSPKSLEMIPACRHTPIQDMETSKDSTQHLNYMRPSAAGFTTQLKGPGGIDLLTTPTTYPNSPSPMSPNSEFLHNSRRTSIITMPPLVAEPLVELGTPHGPSFAQNSIAAKTHSRKAMIICSWNGCGKEFAKPSLLKAHLNVHTMV